MTGVSDPSTRFVPEGTGPKVYSVICDNASDWNEIHNYIINENELDGIPNRAIDCVDLYKTSNRMASYEMSDAEAEQLRNHPKVIGVDYSKKYYQGTYNDSIFEICSKTNRYDSNVKVTRRVYSNSTEQWLSRTAGSIGRHRDHLDPWSGISDLYMFTEDPQYYGDGSGVDVIVNDTAAWFGHIEFVKTGVGEPTNFVGTNILKSGFATSATTGVCGVLDVVLHAPYYIDPDWFEADPTNRLEKRWDGTTVPVGSVAIDWWNDDTKRSAKYCPVGSTTVDGDAGTAVVNSAEDFGTIAISANYTEAIHNGNNTTINTGLYNGSVSSHGTACMSQAYGKTHGWAFNSNKWFIAKWSLGAPTTSEYFKLVKVFHQLKPINTVYGTKDPTISSTSWILERTFSGFNNIHSNGEYAYFRTNGDGTNEEQIIFEENSNNVPESPAWVSNFYNFNKYAYPLPFNDEMHINGSEMIDAGVILFGGAGNNNQKMVLDGHSDYNNYIGTNSSVTLAEAKSNTNGTLVNRPGFPVSASVVENYNGSGTDKYRAFNIGSLHAFKTISNTQENKANSSNCGEAVDCYAIGQWSLSASNYSSGSASSIDRFDNYYRIDNYQIVTSGGTLSHESLDRNMSGTSSACPVSAGLIATKLQYNRHWTWESIKHWIENNVTDQTESAFYTGTEATTSDDSNWESQHGQVQGGGGYNLQGGARKILWDAPYVQPTRKQSISMTGSLKISGNGLSITKSS